jgi:hypothetical protein
MLCRAPSEWPHLTTRRLGFVDEVAERDVPAIVEATCARPVHASAFDPDLDHPVIAPDAVRSANSRSPPGRVTGVVGFLHGSFLPLASACCRANAGAVRPRVPPRHSRTVGAVSGRQVGVRNRRPG